MHDPTENRIPVAMPWIGEEEARAVYDVVSSGWISMGVEVERFEAEFAAAVGARNAVAVNNGTSALHLALITAGIKEGDEVLVPDITFISSANVVLYERARPVLVECDRETYNLSLEDAADRVTPRTRAIIPVDMNGLPVDYDGVREFATRHGLAVIADSAESLGSVYRGRRVGTQAPIHIFSFFPNKAVTTGEGGMITTEDDERAAHLRILRNQGQSDRYHHVEVGYNYRMPDVLAAIGRQQLRRLDETLREREKLARRYTELLAGDQWIRTPTLPAYTDRTSWYMYAIDLADGIDRDAVVRALAEDGIDTRLSFPPIHTQPCYRERFGYEAADYPASTRAWSQLIDLPIWVGMSPAIQERVVDTLRSIVGSLAAGRVPAVSRAGSV